MLFYKAFIDLYSQGSLLLLFRFFLAVVVFQVFPPFLLLPLPPSCCCRCLVLRQTAYIIFFFWFSFQRNNCHRCCYSLHFLQSCCIRFFIENIFQVFTIGFVGADVAFCYRIDRMQRQHQQDLLTRPEKYRFISSSLHRHCCSCWIISLYLIFSAFNFWYSFFVLLIIFAYSFITLSLFLISSCVFMIKFLMSVLIFKIS